MVISEFSEYFKQFLHEIPKRNLEPNYSRKFNPSKNLFSFLSVKKTLSFLRFSPKSNATLRAYIIDSLYFESPLFESFYSLKKL